MDGQIDGVSIFNYALSSNQVTTLYGSSSTGIGNPMSLSPKPVFYAPLGDQDAFNGANYLVPNASLQDYVFDFNSSSNYINCGNNLNLTNALTVSLWVKINSAFPDNIGPVLASQDTGSGTTRKWGIIHVYGNLTIQTFANSGTQNPQINISSSTIESDNKWSHIVFTVDGTTNTNGIKAYLNKVNVSSVTANGTGLNSTPNTNLIIGGYESSYRLLNGEISNFQIFNTALPATGSNSVETIYNNGTPLTSMSGFTSLVSWWKLDASATFDGTNWSIPDDSSNSNTGTSSGMTQSALQQSDLQHISGYSPYALQLDGTSNFIDCGATPIVTGVFTFSLWIKRSSTSSGAASQVIIGKDGQSSNRVFNVFISLSGVIGFWVSETGTYSSTYRINTSTLINDTNWHNLIVINNGNNNNNQVFIDGTEASYVDQGTGRTTLYNTTGAATSIGSSANSPTAYPFNGSISNASIWNTALTSSQVTEIYNEGVPSNLNNHSAYSNLVSWWQLGSNSSFNSNSWTVLDEKGTNNGVSSTNMSEVDIVNGVGYSSNGVSSGMSDNVVGSAPYSTANSLSINMDVLDRTTDIPS